MITTPTVFVLGAGASNVYGFPTGEELIHNLKINGFRDLHLADHGITEENFMHFQQELRRSTLGSIDSFLQNRPEFVSVGKLAIAHHLIQFEAPDKLFLDSSDGQPEPNWMRFLFMRMIEGTRPENFHCNRVSFVTFNYDRSLEAFLFEAIRASMGLNYNDARSLMMHFPIFHVHGQLGLLPWQSSDSDESRIQKYTANLGERDLDTCASEIRLVSEERQSDTQIRVKTIIKAAQRVFFLGFGYHLENLQRIGIHDVINSANSKFWGTCKGLFPEECDRITRLINAEQNRLEFSPSHRNITESLRSCREFQEL